MKKTYIILIVLSILVAGYFLYVQDYNIPQAVIETPGIKEEEKNTQKAQEVSTSKYKIETQGLNAYLYKDNEIIQTLPVQESGEGSNALWSAEMAVNTNQNVFIVGDINFDTHPDVALITGSGYSGRSMYYTYYVFNPSTQKLERDNVLLDVVNPNFNPGTRIISSTQISGLCFYTRQYTFNGTAYTAGEIVEDCPEGLPTSR